MGKLPEPKVQKEMPVDNSDRAKDKSHLFRNTAIPWSFSKQGDSRR